MPVERRGRKSVEATWKGLDFGLSGALNFGAILFQEVWGSEDFKEGNRAFKEGRQPSWRGR